MKKGTSAREIIAGRQATEQRKGLCVSTGDEPRKAGAEPAPGEEGPKRIPRVFYRHVHLAVRLFAEKESEAFTRGGHDNGPVLFYFPHTTTSVYELRGIPARGLISAC